MEKFDMLIDEVRRNELLYNHRMRRYRDKTSRQEAWEKIGRHLGVKGEVAKDAWEKLRRCFSNAINRRRIRKKNTPWKYEKKMSFLIPFTEHRRSEAFADGVFDFNNKRRELAVSKRGDEENDRLSEESSDKCYDVSYEVLENPIQVKKEVTDSPDREAVIYPSDSLSFEDFSNGRMGLNEAAEQFDNEEAFAVRPRLSWRDSVESTASNSSLSRQEYTDSRAKKEEGTRSSDHFKHNRTERPNPEPHTSTTPDLTDKRIHLTDFDETEMFFFSMGRAVKTLPPVEQAQIKLILSNAVFQAQIKQLRSQPQHEYIPQLGVQPSSAILKSAADAEINSTNNTLC